MRRAAMVGFFILICAIIAGLCQTAVDPADFTGRWYASSDQSSYTFREGIVFCSKSPVEDSISGAYTFSRKSIFLFAKGVPGLEQEKQLYLVERDNSSFLCENPDGTGAIYFIRYKD